METEWIVGCGVRFFGQRELDQAILINYAGSVLFAAIGLLAALVAVGLVRQSEGFLETAAALVILVVALSLFIPAMLMWSDAVCYKGIS